MTALELISAGRFTEAATALKAEVASCTTREEALAAVERARRAALAARAMTVDELRRVNRRRLVRAY